ncbi:hypothetical protein [Desulfoscipio geothermicus]|uniref:Uncharacterized protein n=1 Tax=Desulfoscipio geothermicus DSM 3669 TaxID=1121426 RepID=A0A1I6EGD7_9FIRM|nr:hypothetical protein [Desulfoscipio geothermicus]SFR16829.1 hypothetical protein SAMN05660706_14215 [Desulfoscipio geothermicus DSM 3669]
MKKWFGNDEDGLSIQDVIALGAFLSWLGISGAFAYFAIVGTLTDIQVNFYSTFIWLPTTVVGGVFGVRAIGGLMTKRQSGYSQVPYYGEDAYADYGNKPPI